MDTNKTTASSGMLEGAEYEKKLKQYYGDMLVYKSSANSKFFSALSLPSFMRDWLVMRFSNSEGVINKQEVSDYLPLLPLMKVSSYANMVLQVKYLFWVILHLKEQKNFVSITLYKH